MPNKFLSKTETIFLLESRINELDAKLDDNSNMDYIEEKKIRQKINKIHLEINKIKESF